jgi:hypothetical protein
MSGYLSFDFRSHLACEMVVMHFEIAGVPRDDEGNVAPDDVLVEVAKCWALRNDRTDQERLTDFLFAVFTRDSRS